MEYDIHMVTFISTHIFSNDILWDKVIPYIFLLWLETKLMWYETGIGVYFLSLVEKTWKHLIFVRKGFFREFSWYSTTMIEIRQKVYCLEHILPPLIQDDKEWRIGCNGEDTFFDPIERKARPLNCLPATPSFFQPWVYRPFLGDNRERPLILYSPQGKQHNSRGLWTSSLLIHGARPLGRSLLAPGSHFTGSRVTLVLT